MFQNVQVGYPIVATSDLIPLDEFNDTLVTSTRYLPKILVEAGIVKSTSEVRRNRKDLCITFPDDMIDCITVKWGKKFLYIVIGKKDPINLCALWPQDENLVGFSVDGIVWIFSNKNDPCMNYRTIEMKHHLVPILREDMPLTVGETLIQLLWR